MRQFKDLFRGLQSAVAITAIFIASFANAVDAERPRLLVLTDIGGDPDDQGYIADWIRGEFADMFDILA